MKKAITLFSILFITNALLAQETSIFDVFYNKDILNVTLETNISTLINNRKLTNDLEGLFTYESERKKFVTIPVEVEQRGKFRRKVCDFPPLKIKFSKEYLKNNGFNSEYGSLKLVTHCKNDEYANENLLKEYLAYKLYNILNGKSLRVQLVRITYKDTGADGDKMKMYAFLMEDSDQMAARLGGEICDCHGTPKDSLSPVDAYTLAVFEYMIANTDWSISMNRNVKLVQNPKSAVRIPVPYDFDFSGIVNAPYAIPDGNFGLKTLRDRILLKQDLPENYDFQKTRDLFLSRKKILLTYVNNFELLNYDQRKELIDYIETFYQRLETQPETWHEGIFPNIVSVAK